MNTSLNLNPKILNSPAMNLPRMAKNGSRKLDKTISLIKKGIWAYFLLVLFEGALRKWVLPGLSTPLLVIRDPLALFLVIAAWKAKLLPFNIYKTGMAFIGVVGIYTAFFLGHGNLFVAIYGARIMLFHFPLLFVIGNIFTQQDVVKLGVVTVWLTIPMAVLIALQFYSPQTAWVNIGLEGNAGGSSFAGAMGFFRPPATFSFTNGTSLFFSFASCFIFFFWLNIKKINIIILIAATIGLIASVPLSLSRALFFSLAVSLVFVFTAIFRKPKYLGSMIMAVVGTLTVLFILSSTSLFQTATEAFFVRFEIGNTDEGGIKGVLLDRYLGGMIGVLAESSSQPFFGYGLGMGTNVGSMLLAGGTFFLISEGEWGRVLGELGPILGLAVILIRVGLTTKLLKAGYLKLVEGDLLPWMLLSIGVTNLPQGGWAQPTSLGFCIIIGGLLMASVRSIHKNPVNGAY
ncbi:MAG: rane protein [Daejeonella sp.]|nr:rane protein [Daejeonella sp.]